MLVSFAIVAYNEERSLPQLLHDLENQDYPHNKIEVLLIDSMSKDSTKSIMEQFSETHSDFFRVVVLENPEKTLPFGCNVALKNYSGDAIVRIDAHATIPNDFISKNVKILQSGEKVSGGKRPNIIDEQTPWKNMLLAAEQSMFGSSIAAYRMLISQDMYLQFFMECIAEKFMIQLDFMTRGWRAQRIMI